MSAGEAASGGGEETACDAQRSTEAGRPHRAGERHKHSEPKIIIILFNR